MTRPALSPELGADEFAAWYWLKHELQAFCRQQGWPASGSKAELMQRVQAAYESHRQDGQLPSRWEVLTALAWSPAPGAPRREQGMDIARFPADRIPLRRR